MYIPKVDTKLTFIDLKFSKVDIIRKMLNQSIKVDTKNIMFLI